ncbi:MAG TPA: tryptophan synthase subunit alpha, partial [Acidobacteriota bacterium]|nr:tryptophan synthase subunit alpha [Acidobacteriota bacterium]
MTSTRQTMMSTTPTRNATTPRDLFSGQPPVIPFLTAGFPSERVFRDAARAAYDAGAGALEIGMPFSDPLA